ncbi:MAG: secondary thiamine-phosphate synthase enzyme YjbQ [Planctomycetota bacterium]|nr:secondary thiamine-phosphate synthase enzyme YjbQ [Planctomycetota bacterium]
MQEISVRTTARTQLVNIDAEVRAALRREGAREGVATIFCPHTTAAVIINENADPDVAHDILATLEHLVPREYPLYRHGEGNSDAHVKACLLGPSVQVLVRDGAPVLGTWQSIYFAEFDGPRSRRIFIALAPINMR